MTKTIRAVIDLFILAFNFAFDTREDTDLDYYLDKREFYYDDNGTLKSK